MVCVKLINEENIMLKNILFSIALTGALISVSHAALMTNKVTGIYNRAKIPTATNPVLCIKIGKTSNFKEWKYGEKLYPRFYSGNLYYFGAAVREGGCSESNLYFGWINVNPITNTITYMPNQASHIQFLGGNIKRNCIQGHLGFTPIGPNANQFPTNPDTTKPSDMTWFAGINLSGLEFSTSPNDSVIPNLSIADSTTTNSDLKATTSFLQQGANIIRLPVRWAYMQPEGPNSTYFDKGYFDDLVMPTLTTITSHNYYVILDLHSYMHYAYVGIQVAGCGGPDGQCPDGKLITDPAPYVAIWQKIWSQIQKDPNIKADHLLFDIVNEPTDDKHLTPEQVFNMETAVIKSLQKEGFPGYFLVEGAHWSGLHSWEDAGNSRVFTRENFEKAGIQNLNKVIINVHQYLDSNYSGTHNECLPDITTVGPNGFNLNQFVSYLQANQFKAIVTEFGVGQDQASCTKPLGDFLQYLKNNAYSTSKGYGFVGWTVWSTGHGWGNYNLRVVPNDWKDKIIAKYFKKAS